MSSASLTRDLGRALRTARALPEAVDAVGRALRAVLAPELLPAGQVTRALAHLRSAAAGYRALVATEWDERGGGSIAPSATVFGWVEKRGAVAVDLTTLRGIELEDGAEFTAAAAYVAGDPSGSMAQWSAREATHLVAMPLLRRGTLEGMLAVELRAPGWTAKPWPTGAWRREVQAIADLAAPSLLLLPVAGPVVGSLPAATDPLLPVVGDKMRSLLGVLSVFASQDETLLIYGPTGAGKSRLAAWCHARSPRSGRRFETANLLAMPETMQMAELFGWKKGAFTGAHSDREGLLGAAEGGTLFLDEIDKLSLGAQAGLLRVLETRRFSPLGGSRERQADVRFVVATNANLVELVHRGEFREDLYYRINVLPVVLDALDQRADEIVAWAQFFTERRHQEAGGEGAVVLDDGARALLTGRSWPGNLRQLDNVMRRSYALWLADRGTGDVLIEAPLLERALGLEMSRAAHPRLAMDLIGRAAELLVEHALTLRRHGDTARLETYDVLRAAVVRAAVDRVGSAKDAFLLFGETARVESRNHARDYKKLLEDIEALEALLARRRS